MINIIPEPGGSAVRVGVRRVTLRRLHAAVATGSRSVWKI